MIRWPTRFWTVALLQFTGLLRARAALSTSKSQKSCPARFAFARARRLSFFGLGGRSRRHVQHQPSGISLATNSCTFCGPGKHGGGTRYLRSLFVRLKHGSRSAQQHFVDNGALCDASQIPNCECSRSDLKVAKRIANSVP